MAVDERPAKRYQFACSIDLTAPLSKFEIEYLTVSECRAITIYTQSILDLEVEEGHLENASILVVEVLDHSTTGGETDPAGLVEALIEMIGNDAGVSFQELEGK